MNVYLRLVRRDLPSEVASKPVEPARQLFDETFASSSLLNCLYCMFYRILKGLQMEATIQSSLKQIDDKTRYLKIRPHCVSFYYFIEKILLFKFEAPK